VSQPPPPPRKSSWWSWIRISEVVGVLALIIAALGFWDNHTDHKLAERARMAAEQKESTAPLVLIGVADPDGGRIALRPARDDQVIQGQTFVFPKDARGDPVETTGAARIEADWFESGLRKAGRAHKGDADDLRMPIGVSTTYLVDGDLRADQSIYDVGYRLEPRFLRSDRVILEGLSVVRRGVPGDLTAAVEQIARARGLDQPAAPAN